MSDGNEQKNFRRAMLTSNNPSSKYTDLDMIYSQCSGPGGLKLAEFMAGKLGLTPGKRLLDVGCNRGIQSCFLAKEFGVSVVAIDPWEDRMLGKPMVELARELADEWGVGDMVLAIQAEVPNTGFTDESFDYVYATTSLEMVRGMKGEDGYLACLQEIRRVLRPGGKFALGEPMHLDIPLPVDLEPYVSQDPFPWKECFSDIHQTRKAVEQVGFDIVEADYAPDARQWWLEFARHGSFLQKRS